MNVITRLKAFFFSYFSSCNIVLCRSGLMLKHFIQSDRYFDLYTTLPLGCFELYG